SRSSRLLMTAAAPPAVFFNLVNPTMTQKPMNRTSTKTALTVNPWTAPMTSCTMLLTILPPPGSPASAPGPCNSPALAGLLPSPPARPSLADVRDRRCAPAHHAEAAWHEAPRRRQTRTDSGSGARAPEGPPEPQVLLRVLGA